jgi:hypothetical protein
MGLRADRERAMLCVAYEALARRGELVALEWKPESGCLLRLGHSGSVSQVILCIPFAILR